MLLHPGAALEPHDLWTAWGTDPWATAALALSGALYATGTRRLWRHAGPGRGVRGREAAAFWGGWLALVVAMVSPLHPLGGALFSAHMTQHELLMVVAAPLLVMGRPMVAATWALPAAWRRPATSWTRGRVVSAGWRAVSTPVHAWWVHVALLWAWHLPALYQSTLRSEEMHALQHASFLGSALVFWWALLRARRAGRALAVGFLFAAMVATGLLGALLTFAGTPWYPSYARTVGAWGITVLDDQRLGGMIMWMPGGLTYLLAALWLMAGTLREPAAPAPGARG